MLVLMDTDHVSILQMRSQPFCDRLEARLAQHAPDQIAISIVSFQENVEGWLAWIKRARTDAQIVEGYRRLGSILHDYREASVLPFNKEAQALFVSLRKHHRRVKTLDLQHLRGDRL